jgi:hypothetical protein
LFENAQQSWTNSREIVCSNHKKNQRRLTFFSVLRARWRW